MEHGESAEYPCANLVWGWKVKGLDFSHKVLEGGINPFVKWVHDQPCFSIFSKKTGVDEEPPPGQSIFGRDPFYSHACFGLADDTGKLGAEIFFAYFGPSRTPFDRECEGRSHSYSVNNQHFFFSQDLTPPSCMRAYDSPSPITNQGQGEVLSSRVV